MIPFDEVDLYIRTLAKDDYWQSLYHQSKEIGGVRLFANDTQFTAYQVTFLGYLAFYGSLYIDIATAKVSDLVLADTIYEDAYAYYRSQERKSKMKVSGTPSGDHGTTVKRTTTQGQDKEEITNKNIWKFTKTRK